MDYSHSFNLTIEELTKDNKLYEIFKVDKSISYFEAYETLSGIHNQLIKKHSKSDDFLREIFEIDF